jgi:predicted enzyme related to lactoylglutathione lyase
MGQPVVHFEVQGNDRTALAQFYAQLFGWKTNDVSEMNYTMVETGADGGINGGIGTTPEGAPGGVTFYVDSNDVAGSLKRASDPHQQRPSRSPQTRRRWMVMRGMRRG